MNNTYLILTIACMVSYIAFMLIGMAASSVWAARRAFFAMTVAMFLAFVNALAYVFSVTHA